MMNHSTESSRLESAEQRAENWHLFLPPARPSAGEVRLYEQILATEPSQTRMLLLGCTPELRSLAHRFGFHLTCTDRYEQVFHHLARLKSCSGPETYVWSEWPDMNLAGGTRLVVGDGSINMLARDQQRVFIRQLAAQMPPGARLILRLHLRGDRQFESEEAIFHHHREHSTGLPFFSAVRSDLDMLWMDEKSGQVDFGECNQRLEQLHVNGMLSDDEWNSFGQMAPFNRISLHYSEAAELKEWIQGHFSVENILVGGDYPRSDMHPVWVMRRMGSS